MSSGKVGGLTIKQENFCLAYVETGNASEAYRRAYPESGRWKDETLWPRASRLLAEYKVDARIKELREAATRKAVQRIGISKEWVLDQLVENVKTAKSAIPVLDADGNPAGEYRTNLQAANRALELIGKELGMFVDRKEIRTGALLEEADTETLLEMRRQIEARKRVH